MREGAVGISSVFVGEGWHLTLGLIFVLIVTFLPGGLIEGVNRLGRLGGGAWRRDSRDADQFQAKPEAAE